MDGLPELEAQRLAAVAARAREVEAAAAGGMTMETGVQVYSESPGGFMVFGQVNLGIPLVDYTARERSLARAEAERLEGTLEARRITAERDALALAQEVDRSRREERALRDTVVPSLERLASQREAQLRAGEATVMMLLDARRRLIAAQTRLTQIRGRAPVGRSSCVADARAPCPGRSEHPSMRKSFVFASLLTLLVGCEGAVADAPRTSASGPGVRVSWAAARRPTDRALLEAPARAVAGAGGQARVAPPFAARVISNRGGAW